MKLKHITCAIRGHRWVFWTGAYLNGKSYPSIDTYQCDRCGEHKSKLFWGGA